MACYWSGFNHLAPWWSIKSGALCWRLGGDEWKQQRKAFNPAFSLKTLIENSLKKMCDETLIFVNILEELAATGETFPLQERVKVFGPFYYD